MGASDSNEWKSTLSAQKQQRDVHYSINVRSNMLKKYSVISATGCVIISSDKYWFYAHNNSKHWKQKQNITTSTKTKGENRTSVLIKTNRCNAMQYSRFGK